MYTYTSEPIICIYNDKLAFNYKWIVRILNAPKNQYTDNCQIIIFSNPIICVAIYLKTTSFNICICNGNRLSTLNSIPINNSDCGPFALALFLSHSISVNVMKHNIILIVTEEVPCIRLQCSQYSFNILSISSSLPPPYPINPNPGRHYREKTYSKKHLLINFP